MLQATSNALVTLVDDKQDCLFNEVFKTLEVMF